MFEVLAIRTVRSRSERPVRGSSSCESSSSTSAASFPRSPQPTYTITSASHHFAICWSRTVFPCRSRPAPPRSSRGRSGRGGRATRCPVTSGASARRRSAHRARPPHRPALRRGQISCAVDARDRVEHRVLGPGGAIHSRTPGDAGRYERAEGDRLGLRHARRARRPARRGRPRRGTGRTAGAGCGRACRRARWSWTNSPAPASGRSMPSKTLPSRPGPSSARSGQPVETTGSPGLSPPVYAYT